MENGQTLLTSLCTLTLALTLTVTQATDYPKIISNKMDMDTVTKTLKLNRYPNVEAFFGDLLLVYDNATRYYEEGGQHKDDAVYEAAKVCCVPCVRHAILSLPSLSCLCCIGIDCTAPVATAVAPRYWKAWYWYGILCGRGGESGRMVSIGPSHESGR